MRAAPIVIFNDMKHLNCPLAVKETVQLKRNPRPRHTKEWGCFQLSAISPKCDVPSNSARTVSVTRVVAS